MSHPRRLFTRMILAFLLTWLSSRHLPCAVEAAEPLPKKAMVVEGRTADEVALTTLQEADQRRITIREANLFHRQFLNTCMKTIPGILVFEYSGVLATDDGRHPPRVYGTTFATEDVVVIGEETAGPTADVVTTRERGGFVPLTKKHSLGEPLHWTVGKEDMSGVIGVWISTERTKQTLAKCRLEDREFFVNVDFVARGESVDSMLPELGGRSVREVLKPIENAKRPLPEATEALPTPLH